MNLEEPTLCPHCGYSFDQWTWIRFRGVGAWEEKNTYWGCPKCKLRHDGTKVPKVVRPKLGLVTIKQIRLDNGEYINKGHLQDIQSRVLDDDGNAIKGKDGLKYMKSKGDKYAGRLRGYYEPKI